MEQLDLQVLMFLLAIGFVAAFIDAVVGGGGLITIPALLSAGLPPAVALGTNKLASSISSFTSSVSFLMSKKMELRLVAKLFPLALVGSALGAYTVSRLPSDFLRPMVVVLLVLILIYTLIKKNWGDRSTYRGMTSKTLVLAALTAFVIAFYDGFFGPGTGSFLIFAFLLFGFDFVRAAGNAKAVNFGTNIGSLATFLWVGSVHLYYGLLMGLAMMLGALVGSQVAIRRGTKFVKPLYVVVTTILIGKQVWDLWLKQLL